MKKDIVEDCLVLDINAFNRDGKLSDGVDRTGQIQWEAGSSIGYTVVFEGDDDGDPRISLFYRCNGQEIVYYVDVVSTPCQFGGRRFWFVCPGRSSDGSPCQRRVGKLYKTAGCGYFLCRHCHDLSYRSRQHWQSQDIKVLSRIMRLSSQLTQAGKGAASQRRRERLLDKAECLARAAHRRGLI